MHAVAVERPPAVRRGGVGERGGETLRTFRADRVVFAREDEQRRLQTAQRALGSVELFGFGEVRDVAGVHHEGRLLRQRVDRVDGRVEGAEHVGVRG